MSLFLLVALLLSEAGGAPQALAGTLTGRVNGGKSFGTVTGSVRDSRGNPLAGALVMLLRDGAEEVVRQTKSATDGSFLARVAPGKYILKAVAEGFNAATFSAVTVNSSDELVYRFNLEPVGQGRTTAERRADRNDAKFRIRSNQSHRSIFQIDEAEDATVGAAEQAIADAHAAETNGSGGTSDAEIIAYRNDDGDRSRTSLMARPNGIVETFYTASADARQNGLGLNFALAQHVTKNLDLSFAGQIGVLDRLETTARLRAGSRHRVSATVGGASLALLPKALGAARNPADDTLGQLSVRAVDEWVVRDGVVLVLGLDYSRFMGASRAHSFSPRFGVQFDAGARTRLHAAYAPGGDEGEVQSVASFETVEVAFREQRRQPIALVDGKAVLERSRRLEFGVERLLGDGSSGIEATAFFDTTDGRGVGLFGASLAGFSGEPGASLLSVANQQGASRGLRVVYTRRISSSLKASAGYAFGRGQQLSPDAVNSPDQLFQSGFFQTAAAQMDADLLQGTRVRTVLRFSPRAAVFAIDPFAGRLAVYDPSLSIQVTQELPTFGLPLRAEAVLDARNLLDLLSSTDDGENLLSVSASRRMLRGGISVRF